MSKKSSVKNVKQQNDWIHKLTTWSTKWIPDSMVFVLALTIIVFFLAWIFTDHGPIMLIDDWVKGFWTLLTFSMQMSLLMITGFVLADAKPVKKLLRKLASIPKTPRSTIIFFTMITGLVWWVHWGVGMMMGIMLGRELALANKGKGIHYATLVASAYTATVCANGPSMAAPLIVATPGHFMESVVGVIPLSETTFDIHLIVLNLVLWVTVPLIMAALLPKKKEDVVEADDAILASFVEVEEEELDKSTLTPAQRWDRSPVLMTIIGLAGLFWVIKFFVTKGFLAMDINTLNFTILIFGMLLHRTPYHFIESIKRATTTVYGIIIQFPFYAGIFGIISYSGLATIIGEGFVAISTAHTYPWIIFVYSSVLNFFVPSGGSKFVIEAPYILPAAQELGANMNYVINAYTSGDTVTNLIQPFWALPILGAFKVPFRTIAPYAMIICVYAFVVISFAYLVFPLLF